MIDKTKLTEFVLRARTKTYAGNAGKVEPLLAGSKQLEYSEDDLMYRDIYNQGNGKFVGIETVYLKDAPLWSMSYYGNFEKMTESEADSTLRKALIEKWDKVRLWNNVTYKMEDFVYTNKGKGSIEEFEGSEEIKKGKTTKYFFYYAGALLNG